MRDDPDDLHLNDLRRRQLFDTAFRGGLSVVLYLAFPAFSDVYRLWERESGNPAFTQIPFEYPPVSALYFEPLTLLPSSRWAVAINGLVMIAAAVATTWTLSERRDPSASSGSDMRLWVASPALILFMPIGWDVLVALIAVLGVVALYDEREAVAGLWEGLGTAFKIFPGAVVLPVLPLISRRRRRVVFLGAGLASLLVPYVAYALLNPDTWAFHLDFASERTDVQSTIWGILDSVGRLLGFSLSAGAINTLSATFIGAGLLALTWWAMRVRPTFVVVAALALIVLLTFNKVFKPQYILWVIPFLAWARAAKLPTRIAESAAVVQFAAIYLALPSLVFPIQAALRVAALGWVAIELMRSSSRRASPTV